MTPSNNIMQQFIIFLYKNNALKPYKDNLLKAHKKAPLIYKINPFYEKKSSYASLISTAFIWDDTPQGFKFWSNLSIQWSYKLGHNEF